MFNAFAKVTSNMDKTGDVKKILDDLAKKQILVGIPEEGNAPHGSIKNAELLYIQSHGVRSPGMIDEMNDSMGIGPDGMPYTKDFNDFLGNLGKGMPYSAAYQLYIQSHGSPLWRIPPRPVLEPSIERNKEAIAKQQKKVMQTALNGQDPTQEMNKTGMLAQNFARARFTDPANEWPANAPSTVKAKGSSNPLIDTGEMRKAITYVIMQGK